MSQNGIQKNFRIIVAKNEQAAVQSLLASFPDAQNITVSRQATEISGTPTGNYKYFVAFSSVATGADAAPLQVTARVTRGQFFDLEFF